MKITTLSDTHNKHNQLKLIGGDILIHCGDISSMGYEHEVHNFVKWFHKQDYTYKIFIAGNHDFYFENPRHKDDLRRLLIDDSVIYLEDSIIEIEGLKIYGTPWTPKFYDWAFMKPRLSDSLNEKVQLIPEDLDILITHGPAFGILDTYDGSQHVGCELLEKKLYEVKPKIHCFGHIHGGYGSVYKNDIHMINCSVLDEQYIYSNEPVSFIYENKQIIDFIHDLK